MSETSNYLPNNGYVMVSDNQQQQQQQKDSNPQVQRISKFLSDCPQAAFDVHNYLQQTYSNSQHQSNQPQMSTPKRCHPLDESGGSGNSGNNLRKHPRTVQQNTPSSVLHTQHTTDEQHQQQQQSVHLPALTQQQTTNENRRQHQRLTFDQLKYAVSSNLPCFHIQIASDTDQTSIPSTLHAIDFILKELQSNGVAIKRFTLIGWAGKRLKLGVNNKEEYAALVNSDKLPTKLNGIDIEVIKPKFTPDSFALVVRYVPHDLDDTFVASEIQRTIASADRIKRIQYSYQRKTNDHRFDVKDFREYQSALQLGRIAAGHSWLSITPFLLGNRMTYCTKCWCIGHLRGKCSSVPRCRICLENYNGNQSHQCSKQAQCAQCGGNHHSLDSQCQMIRDYKDQLKENVEDAIKRGKLHRYAPSEQATPFEIREQDFPAITTAVIPSRDVWNVAQTRTTSSANETCISEMTKTFHAINSQLSEVLESSKRVENKVEKLSAELKIVTLDTQLHQAVLADFIDIMRDFTREFLPILLNANKDERRSLFPVTQQYYNRFNHAAISLISGFQLNRNIRINHLPTSYPISQSVQPISSSSGSTPGPTAATGGTLDTQCRSTHKQ